MLVDNQSAIKLAGNPEFHKRTKHIDVRYHYVREVCEQGGIVLKYIDTTHQLADVFTKPLPKQSFKGLIQELGISA
ncbi:hypothetical protein KPH14_012291 [Odynerus spinipes]|uniref:Copia protein n=1 Tax=Odynerus spinipes TaxID=1348599 RepID=A0AAD9VLN4_9HYME|nr:hypothetical protein KPH14_012291 [Odynerus spinipes]